ncbi:MAG: efflux RND transporter periplasmic adaptor subunit [Acidobacteria bacterium]|nr:efflux RND transporter periplasmic adaptor subunit [Acidobacteriota bacterium]MDW7984775.1 efflux RND transporter periplasmic adaptor subunit [Acidobacteriota bacterium]
MRKRVFWFIIPPSILLLVGLIVWFRPMAAQTRKADPAAAPETRKRAWPVQVAEVRRGPIRNFTRTTATLEPDRQVQVVSETEGLVLQVYVDEGDYVQEGQILASIDAEAKQLALERAVVRLKKAQKDLERKKAALATHIISQSEYDQAQYEADLAEAEKKAAEVELSRCTIRAPIAGIVTERWIEPGQRVQPRQSIFVLVDAEPLRARIYLPEKDIQGIRPNQVVDLALNAQEEVTFQGRIEKIHPVVDPQTGTVKITLIVLRPPPQVRPGSFVDVRVVTQRREAALLVPKRALIEEYGETYVFVVQDGRALRRKLQVGFADDQFVEALTGVEAGDRVVTAGQGSLRDGVSVEVVQ